MIFGIFILKLFSYVIRKIDCGLLYLAIHLKRRLAINTKEGIGIHWTHKNCVFRMLLMDKKILLEL